MFHKIRKTKLTSNISLHEIKKKIRIALFHRENILYNQLKEIISHMNLWRY